MKLDEMMSDLKKNEFFGKNAGNFILFLFIHMTDL